MDRSSNAIRVEVLLRVFTHGRLQELAAAHGILIDEREPTRKHIMRLRDAGLDPSHLRAFCRTGELSELAEMFGIDHCDLPEAELRDAVGSALARRPEIPKELESAAPTPEMIAAELAEKRTRRAAEEAAREQAYLRFLRIRAGVGAGLALLVTVITMWDGFLITPLRCALAGGVAYVIARRGLSIRLASLAFGGSMVMVSLLTLVVLAFDDDHDPLLMLVVYRFLPAWFAHFLIGAGLALDARALDDESFSPGGPPGDSLQEASKQASEELQEAIPPGAPLPLVEGQSVGEA